MYRIQDKDGRGPFRPIITDKWIQYRDDHRNLKATIIEFSEINFTDIKTLIKPDEKGIGSGCTDLNQLKRWFIKQEYYKLLKLGYKAVKIRSNRIIAESDTQCIFTSNKPLKKVAKPFKLYDKTI